MRWNEPVLPAALLTVLVAGCAHRFETQPLERYEPDQGYRFPIFETGPNNSNDLFVCLTFSGGGTRAAALSYGVMEELKHVHIDGPNGRVRLLDEVDVIASVSGGSFTAGYYGLFGEGLFDDFKNRFLLRDIQGDLTWAVINPLNWFRLASPSFARIDLAAEIYNDVFRGGTYAEVAARAPRPFIALNATNMTMGSQLSFIQDHFDVLGSDVEKYRVANAAAASSAFPIALSPATLRNHPTPQGYAIPDWIRLGLEDPLGNPARAVRARTLAPYQQDKDGHPYVHLLDGGLSDNLGLRMIEDSYQRGFLRQLVNGVQKDEHSKKERIQKLLIIVVNAKTSPNQNLDESSSAPGALEVALKTMTTSMDNYTFETVESMSRRLNERRQAQDDLDECQQLLDEHAPDAPKLPRLANVFDAYMVEVSFDRIENRERRDYFNNLPTSFALEEEQVNALIDIGGALLMQDEEFQDFLAETGGGP